MHQWVLLWMELLVWLWLSSYWDLESSPCATKKTAGWMEWYGGWDKKQRVKNRKQSKINNMCILLIGMFVRYVLICCAMCHVMSWYDMTRDVYLELCSIDMRLTCAFVLAGLPVVVVWLCVYVNVWRIADWVYAEIRLMVACLCLPCKPCKAAFSDSMRNKVYKPISLNFHTINKTFIHTIHPVGSISHKNHINHIPSEG